MDFNETEGAPNMCAHFQVVRSMIKVKVTLKKTLTKNFYQKLQLSHNLLQAEWIFNITQ